MQPSIPDYLDSFYKTVDSYYSGERIAGLEAFLLAEKEKNEAACQRERLSREEYLSRKCAIANELGTFYRVRGAQEKSAEAFSEAVSAVGELCGQNSIQYATAVNNLAGTYRLAGKSDEAILCFKEALSLLEKTGDFSLKAAASNNLGLVYLELRNYAEAEQYFHESLSLLHEAGADAESMHAELAVTYNNIASSSFMRGDLQTAESFCLKAAAEYEKVSAEERGHLGSVYNTIGAIAESRGDRERARNYYLLAQEWIHRFFGNNYEYKALQEKLEKL